LYYVSQLAGQQVKVVLAGQGADEPLAGYDRYIGESYISKFSGVLRLFPLEAITATLPRNERLKRAAFASRFDDGVDRIMALYTIFTPSMKQSLLLPAVQEAMGDVDRVQVERLHAQAGKLKGTLAKLLYMDARLSLADNLLLFGDKMSMANSLEMRVPFLDLELMRFLESLPSSYKLRGRTGKYLHKRVLRRWLPPAIIARKKRGFVTPMDPWLQGSLADSANRMFNERDSAARRYFSLPAINEMIEKHKSRRENYRRHIFALLCFELWHRIIVEGRSPGEFHLDTDQN
jgi:asparagine synthase (glutamine-hydrolysing)